MIKRWTRRIACGIFWCLHMCSGLRFTLEPTDSIVALSRPFSWACVATADQPIKYSWSFAGQVLPLHGNQVINDDGTLYLRMVTADDVGNYTCSATAGGESIQSQEARLQLAYIDPTFSSHPQTQTQLLAARLVLSCSISSLPLAKISWLLDGKPVTRGTVSMADNGTSSLDLYPVLYQVAGTYKCMATNPMLGVYVYSLSGDLTVKGQPVFLSSLESVSVPLGFTATFNCNFYANPEPSVTWYAHPTSSDGSVSSIKIVNSDKYSVHSNGTFHVYNVSEDDAIFYSCNVRNSFGTMSESALLIVSGEATVPSIQTGPNNQTVNVGGNVSFLCEANGNPKPRISWKYGDDDLISDDRVTISDGRLDLRSVRYGDTGWYWCISENQLGAVNQSAYLQVQVAPTIDMPPEDINILLGSPLSLQCVSSGRPEPDVVWQTPNSGVITSSNSTSQSSVQADGTLRVVSVTLEDTGKYTCKASNVVGEVQASAQVRVEAVPVFTRQPVSQSVNKGDKVFLHCQASGIPKPTYTWSKQGEGTIQSRTDRQIYMNNTLVVHAVKQTDAGLYSCTARNLRGETTAVATITVTVAPSFPIRPVDQTVRLGGRVQLQCVSAGDPVPTQRWLKQGRIIVTGGNVYVSQNHTILTITGITEDQFGEYTCTATNMAGTSSVSALIQAEDIPKFTVKPANTTVNQSDRVSLPCEGQARETPTIKWYRQTAGRIVEVLSEERVIVTSTELTIKSSLASDEGWYYCVTANSAGNQSVPVFVNVQVPPDIYHTNSPRTTVSQSPVTLTCQSSGDPPPSLQWYNPSKKLIDASPSYIMKDNSLQIVSANHTTDDGAWTCKACNVIGCDQAVIDLRIEGMPYIHHFHGNKAADIITLKCSATSVPPPSLTFTSQGQVVTSDLEGHTVSGDTLSVVWTLARKEYTCKAGNKYGTAYQSVTVPSRMEAPAVTNINSRWVTLQWTEPRSDSSLPVIGYKIQVTSDLGITWQNVDLKGQNYVALERLNITDLLPYIEYKFRVAGVNILGVGEFSGMSTMIRTLAAAPSPPTSLVALEIGDGVIMLSWQPPLQLNGDIGDIAYQYTVRKAGYSYQSQDAILVQGTVFSNETLQADIPNMTESVTFEVYVRALNMALNLSSSPTSMTIDKTTPQTDSKTQDGLSPDKLIAIVFGALGGVVMVMIVIFIVVHIRHQRKSKSLSFVDSRLSLDQFYMENPKNLYNDKPRSMKKSHSRQSFYKFDNDDSFHNNGSFINGQGQIPSKRPELDTDVLLVAKNPLYREAETMNTEMQQEAVSQLEPSVTADLLKSHQEGVQEEIELPTSRVRAGLTPLSLSSPSGSDKWREGTLDSETGSVCFTKKEPLTPLSAENLEDDIMMIYSSVSQPTSQHSCEHDHSLDHVYSSIHSEGQRSRTSSVPVSSECEDINSARPKPPIRVLSPGKLRASSLNDEQTERCRLQRSASPAASYASDTPDKSSKTKSKSLSPSVSSRSGNSGSPKPPVRVTSVDKLRGPAATDNTFCQKTVTASVHSDSNLHCKSDGLDSDDRQNSDVESSITQTAHTESKWDHGDQDESCVPTQIRKAVSDGNDNDLFDRNDNMVVRPIQDVKVEDNYLTDNEIRLQTLSAGLY